MATTEAWEARWEQLQAAPDLILLCVARSKAQKMRTRPRISWLLSASRLSMPSWHSSSPMPQLQLMISYKKQPVLLLKTAWPAPRTCRNGPPAGAQQFQLLSQLLRLEQALRFTAQAAVQTESEDKNLRETVEKQEFQLQLAAGDKLMLKDENSNCRRIALDALKEKNGYKAELAAAQRHLGFLTEGEELENQENEAILEVGSLSRLPSVLQWCHVWPQDSGEQAHVALLYEDADTVILVIRNGEALLPRAADGRIILKNEDMVAAYAAHFGQTPTPEQLRNWVKNSHGQAISYKEARNLIASAKEAKKQAMLFLWFYGLVPAALPSTPVQIVLNGSQAQEKCVGWSSRRRSASDKSAQVFWTSEMQEDFDGLTAVADRANLRAAKPRKVLCLRKTTEAVQTPAAQLGSAVVAILPVAAPQYRDTFAGRPQTVAKDVLSHVVLQSGVEVSLFMCRNLSVKVALAAWMRSLLGQGSLQPINSVQEGMAQRMEDFERQLAKVDELTCRIEAMANTVEANIASTREEGSSSSTTTDPSILHPVLTMLEGLSKRMEDFEKRFAKVDELSCRIEAMANTVEANIASTREEGSSSSTATDASMIPVQPVLSVLEGLMKRLEDFEKRLAKVDELSCRIEAMATTVEANTASTCEEAWEARCEQLQAAPDVILLCVASRAKQSPEDADKAANIVASQRIENIDAQLAQLLADASASAYDFI
ncbi:unnamed protein product [Symbiodinium sp. CCMP2592]|nr:unnamed protein product [Symbiodinium sp. CCMP2592]